MSLTKILVTELPDCQFPHETPTTARYDGKTRSGPWGYMCFRHFVLHGIGLGQGKGQELVLDDDPKGRGTGPDRYPSPYLD